MEDTMRDSDANTAQENLQRMKTLDDAWNSQNWEVFRKRHAADTKVYWPGQPDPTTGRDAHHHESEAFFKSIENHLENDPYKVMFASGDWTCTVAVWKGRMIGPWKGLDGKVHQPTNKTFELEFCTVARWKNGEIAEEELFYDQVSFMRQIGIL
jgi:ketosteroid isomerase-like protein